MMKGMATTTLMSFAEFERLDAGAHALFGQPAHFEQTALQRLELLLKVRYDAVHGH